MNRILFFVILIAASMLCADKAPFSIEALYKLKNITDPRISPDGSKIIFTVTSYNLKEGSSNSEIYIMNADGSEQKRLTKNNADDREPQCQPMVRKK